MSKPWKEAGALLRAALPKENAPSIYRSDTFREMGELNRYENGHILPLQHTLTPVEEARRVLLLQPLQSLTSEKTAKDNTLSQLSSPSLSQILDVIQQIPSSLSSKQAQGGGEESCPTHNDVSLAPAGAPVLLLTNFKDFGRDMCRSYRAALLATANQHNKKTRSTRTPPSPMVLPHCVSLHITGGV